jgi:hypothetical protein
MNEESRLIFFSSHPPALFGAQQIIRPLARCVLARPASRSPLLRTDDRRSTKARTSLVADVVKHGRLAAGCHWLAHTTNDIAKASQRHCCQYNYARSHAAKPAFPGFSDGQSQKCGRRNGITFSLPSPPTLIPYPPILFNGKETEITSLWWTHPSGERRHPLARRR